MSRYMPVIHQAQNAYASSSEAPSSSSDSSRMSYSTSSTYSRSPYSSSSSDDIIINSNHSTSGPQPMEISRSTTKPPRLIKKTPYGNEEFIETGRPHGGNPNGGPARYPNGYVRVANDQIVIHNTGGQSTGFNSVKLAPEAGNGQEHAKGCREATRLSDNHGLCHC